MVQAEKTIFIHDDTYHYTAAYYTTNKWVDADTLVLSRSESETIGAMKPEACELVLYSCKDQSMKVICNDITNFNSYVVHQKLVYYTNRTQLRCIDLDTGENRLIYEKDFDEIEAFGGPQITNDGKTVSLYANREDFGGFFFTVDTQTGRSRKLLTKRFESPFHFANHGMICPENPDLLFFAHEGNTFYISNRLWLYDAKTDKAWNLAKQSLNQCGNLGDCFGHESWAYDGKGMYFVKYPCSPTPPTGICYVDIGTGKHELLYTSYNYWHVGSSQDGRFLLADTLAPDHNEVVVIDREDGSETVIDRVKGKAHPAHPHPQMSLDNKKVVYTALDDAGRTGVKITFLKQSSFAATAL